MDRRDFFKLGASGVAWTMIPGCSTSALPQLDTAPGALAIADDGTRFEVRSNAHQLVITARGGQAKIVGGLGTAPGKLNFPIRVATSANVGYVVDCGNHRVQAFDGSGASVATIGEGELCYPKGIAFGNGELLVADSRNARIAGFDANGDLANSYGNGVLAAPCGIASLGATLLVADPGLHQVVELDRTGRIIRRYGADFILPYDVATDGTNVFVVDAAIAEVAVHDRNGRRTGSIALDAAATFVSLASDGMLYAG